MNEIFMIKYFNIKQVCLLFARQTFTFNISIARKYVTTINTGSPKKDLFYND